VGVAAVAVAAPRRPRVLRVLVERQLLERRLLADLPRLVEWTLLLRGLHVDRAEPECALLSHPRKDLQWPRSRISARTCPDVCLR
jgi:hypothetical protein